MNNLFKKIDKKIIKNNFESLTNKELLIVLLKKNLKINNNIILNIMKKLINKTDNFVKLIDITKEKITEIKDIKNNKIIQLQIIFEFIKRFENKKKDIKIKCPEDVFAFLEYDFENEKKEYFYILLLNKNNKIIDKTQLYQGTKNKVIIDLRDIFGFAFKKNARKIICVHNHPSGNSVPSVNDRKTTEIIKDIGNKLNIPLVDHIIIGKNECFSIFLKKKYLIKNN